MKIDHPDTHAPSGEGQISPITAPNTPVSESPPILVEVTEQTRFVFEFTAASLADAIAQHGSVEDWFASLDNPVMQADEFVVEDRTVTVDGQLERAPLMAYPSNEKLELDPPKFDEPKAPKHSELRRFPKMLRA